MIPEGHLGISPEIIPEILGNNSTFVETRGIADVVPLREATLQLF